jgi:CSLREA domain-containing protein
MGRTLFFPTSLKLVAAAGAAFVLWGLLFALTSSPAQAATYTVNTALDTAEANDGACTTDFEGCTLREAINAANASSSVADTINFDLNQLELITLVTSSELPTITGSAFAGLTIDGSAVNITISGQEQHRVFRIGSSARVTLDSITVANGNAEGGDGGGIYNEGDLQVSRSTISDNSASSGGGIYNEGSLGVTNSTISGNHATSSGGGIYSEGALQVINSTISGNSADMGGGIFVETGTAEASNTLLSGNSASSEDSSNCSGFVGNLGNNLDSGTSCGFGTNNNSLSGVDPMLGDLADNGGPTETHALLGGSPAINKGNNDALDIDLDIDPLQFDQRGPGFARIVGGIVDIGAFEVQGLGSEPPPDEVPEDKQACKKGGYEEFGFKNQGQCIKAVNHAG